jgi:hypothetical protein
VVELRGRLVVPGAPGRAAVHAHDGPLIARHDHPPGIRGIDPELVVVVAAGCALQGDEVLPAVGRAVQRRVAGVDHVPVLGVDGHGTEVPAARPDPPVAVDEPPAGAAVVRDPEPAFPGVHDRVDTPGVARRHRDPDSSETLGREPAGDPAPGVAPVGRPIEAAAGSVRRWIDVPGRTARLPEGCEKNRGVLGVERQIDRARVLVPKENPLPGPAAVPGSIHPSLRIGAVRVAEGRDVDQVGVAGVNQDAADLPAVFEADPLPARPAVIGPVHPVAVRDVGAHVGLARARVEDPGVRRGDRESPDRGDRLAVEDRSPRSAGVVRAPDSTPDRPEVEALGASGNARHRQNPAAPEGPDQAPPHAGEQCRVEWPRGRGDRGERQACSQDARTEAEHETPPSIHAPSFRERRL